MEHEPTPNLPDNFPLELIEVARADVIPATPNGATSGAIYETPTGDIVVQGARLAKEDQVDVPAGEDRVRIPRVVVDQLLEAFGLSPEA